MRKYLYHRPARVPNKVIQFHVRHAETFPFSSVDLGPEFSNLAGIREKLILGELLVVSIDGQQPRPTEPRYP